LDADLVNVHDMAFSHDGKWLAAAGGVPGEEGAVEVYAWPEGSRRFRSNFHDDLVYAIAWRNDNAVLATASLDNTCGLVDVRTGDPMGILKGHSLGVTAVGWLADGQTLVTAGIDHSVRVWSASSGAALRVLHNHTEPVHDMAVRPQPRGSETPMIATLSSDRTVRLWQPTIGRLVRFARLEAVPLSVVWSGDGSVILVSCGDGHVRVIDPDSVQVLHDLPALGDWAYSVAVHPESGELLVGGPGGQLKRLTAPHVLRQR
jgi:WD40 repeat protein